MSIWLNNKTRIHHHTSLWIKKPCHILGWCPYGQLVEAFPLHEEARAYAIEHDMYVKLVIGKGWVECDKNDPAASPDLNNAVMLVDEKYSCKVFGHDCPVFYHAEELAEKIENKEKTNDGDKGKIQ